MFLPVGKTPGLRIGSPPGPGSMYCPSKSIHKRPELVISHDLPQTELQVLEERLEHLVLGSFNEALGRQGFPVRRLAEHAPEGLLHHILDLLDAALRVRRLLDQGADGGARALRDLLEEFHVLEHALVRVAVDLFQFSPFGVREDA